MVKWVAGFITYISMLLFCTFRKKLCVRRRRSLAFGDLTGDMCGAPGEGRRWTDWTVREIWELAAVQEAGTGGCDRAAPP